MGEGVSGPEVSNKFQEWPRQTKPKKGQFMNFSQGHSRTKVQCESCLFSQGKTPEFTKMGEIHELFVLGLFLVLFAGATPESFEKVFRPGAPQKSEKSLEKGPKSLQKGTHIVFFGGILWERIFSPKFCLTEVFLNPPGVMEVRALGSWKLLPPDVRRDIRVDVRGISGPKLYSLGCFFRS